MAKFYDSRHTGEELDKAIDFMTQHEDKVQEGVHTIEDAAQLNEQRVQEGLNTLQETYEQQKEDLLKTGGKAENIVTNDGGNVEEKLSELEESLDSFTVYEEFGDVDVDMVTIQGRYIKNNGELGTYAPSNLYVSNKIDFDTIEVTIGHLDNGTGAMAFYATDDLSNLTNPFKVVLGISGVHTYIENVPKGTKAIAFYNLSEVLDAPIVVGHKGVGAKRHVIPSKVMVGDMTLDEKLSELEEIEGDGFVSLMDMTASEVNALGTAKKIIGTDGTVRDNWNAAAKATVNAIPLVGNPQFVTYQFLAGGGDTSYNIAFYDADDVFIKGYKVGKEQGAVEVPENAASIRFAAYAQNGFFSSIHGVKKEIHVSISQQVKDNKNQLAISTDKYYTCEEINILRQYAKSIAEDGAIVYENSSKCSPFIKTNGSKVISMTYTYGGRSNRLSYAFYDKEKTFLFGGKANKGSNISVEVPFDAEYVVFSGDTDGSGNIFSYFVGLKKDDGNEYNKEIIELAYDYMFPNKGKSIAVLGDSITHQGYWWKYLADFTKASICGYGISGYTFGTGTWGQIYTEVANVSTADIVIVFGGTNDFGMNTSLGERFIIDDSTGEKLPYDVTSTTCGGLHKVITDVRAKFPTAKIIGITPLPRADGEKGSRMKNAKGLYLQDYIDAIKDIYAFYSIPCLDLFANSNLDPNVPEISAKYFQDNLHPNEEGHNVIAKLMNRFLCNWIV